MAYKTSDFRKGLKVQINGEPYVMTSMEFKKPGKGNALFICKLKNLLRGTTLDRTFKGNDTLEEAEIHETNVKYLYNSGDTWVFMDEGTYEQYEMSKDQIGDDWNCLLYTSPSPRD